MRGFVLGAAHHVHVFGFIVSLLWDDWRHHPKWPE
jgi:hypothetical protein